MSETNPEAAEKGSFADELQGFASFCETCIQDRKMDVDDMSMVRDKFRDAAFVVSQLTTLRDQLRAEISALKLAATP